MFIHRQFRALGSRDLPKEVRLRGKVYARAETFKHTSISAVGVYRSDDGQKLVLKCYRRAPFFGMPAAWVGWMMAHYEAAVLRCVEGVRGVPHLRGLWGRTAILRDYVPGQALTRESRVDDGFFDDLFRLLGELHERGIAYVDLEKASNIILGDDGRPHLIDFQVAFYMPRRFLGETCVFRWVRRTLQDADLYHARKHFRRLQNHKLTKSQVERLRVRPWLVRMANVLHAPLKELRRYVLGRS